MRTHAKIILAVAICLALVGGQTVAAKGGKASTTVDLTEVEVNPQTQTGTYTGKVRSTKKKCKDRRKVTVIHDSDPPFVIGSTLTDDRGNWSLDGPVPPPGDRVIVEVKKNSKCKGTSETYQLEEAEG